MEDAVVKEIKEVKSMLETLLTKRGCLPNDNNLLSPGDVLNILGIRHDNKDWTRIRRLLIERYGMSRLPGVGYRIPRKNLEFFLQEMYPFKQ